MYASNHSGATPGASNGGAGNGVNREKNILIAHLGRLLQHSNNRFRILFDNSNDSILALDPANDKVVDANERAAAMLGYPRDELLQQRISDIHPGEMPKFIAFAQSVEVGGQAFTDSLTCMTKSGQALFVEISAAPIIYGEQTLLAVFVRNVTERKKAEVDLLRHIERLKVIHEIDTDLFKYLDQLTRLRSGPLRRLHDILSCSFTGVYRFDVVTQRFRELALVSCATLEYPLAAVPPLHESLDPETLNRGEYQIVEDEPPIKGELSTHSQK